MFYAKILEERWRGPITARESEHRVPHSFRFLTRFGDVGLALVVYVVAAVVATWPLSLHLTEALWVGRFDVWVTAWLLGWLHTSVADGTLGLNCDAVFYPLGKSVLVFGHVGLQLLGSTLVPLVGVAGAYNVVLLGAMTASALGAYLLVRELVEDRGAALVAGLLFGFSPWILLEASVGSLENACAVFLPLGMLGLVRMQREPGVGHVAFTAFATLFAALVSWYFAIFLALAGAMFTAFHAIRDRKPDFPFLGRAAGAVGLCLVLTGPLALLVYPAATRPRLPLTPDLLTPESRQQLQRFVDGQTPLSELTPDALDRFAAAEVYFNSYSPLNQWSGTPPADPIDGRIASVLLYAGLVGAFAAGRRGLFWVLLTAVFWVLAMGPGIRVGEFTQGAVDWNGLPYKILYNATEVLRQAFRPYRFLVMADLGLAVLAGYGLAWLARGRTGAARTAFYAVAVVLVLACRWIVPDHPPVRLESSTAPEHYRALAREPGRFALLELPFYAIPSTAAQTRYVYYQALHGKPILNDHFVRTTELLRLLELMEENSALAAFLGLTRPEAAWPPRVRPEDVRWFADQGFRDVNLHTWFEADPGAEDRQMRIEALRVALVHLFGEPEPAGDGIEVFRVAGAEGRSAADWPDLPFEILHDALLPSAVQTLPDRVETLLESEDGLAGVSFWAYCPPSARQPLKVTLEGGGRERSLSATLRPGCWCWVQVRDEGGPLARPGQRLRMVVELPGVPLELRRVCLWKR